MIYFVWIGIFSLMIVAQFWSFANDVYSKEEGERLLVIVGLGASLGAVVGARFADRLIEPFGVLQLMLVGAGRARSSSCCSPTTSTAPSAAAVAPKRGRQGERRRHRRRRDQRLRDGVQDALPAADGADDPDAQLGQQHRRVHPRQHREGRTPQR